MNNQRKRKLTAADRLLWGWLCEVWSDWRPSLMIVKPETVIAWHRMGFRLLWTSKVRNGQVGRPTVTLELRELIRKMIGETPLWGAPRIHGELLKLGIDIGETSIGKYMARGRKPPSQTWRTFLENHVKTMVSVDFFTVPTIRFQMLYVFVVLAHERRRILHFGVTTCPTAEWTAQQLRQAFPWETAPRLSPARSGSDLRGGLCDAGEGNRHQTGARGAGIALVGSLRGTGDRHHSPGVPGSGDRIQ
jgi:hypothetical protein